MMTVDVLKTAVSDDAALRQLFSRACLNIAPQDLP
jgi:hypothetical protein